MVWREGGGDGQWNKCTKCSLLNYLSMRAECTQLSELQTVSAWRLYQILTELPTEAHPLEEWRAALGYLYHGEKAETAEQAKSVLLQKFASQIVL